MINALCSFVQYVQYDATYLDYEVIYDADPRNVPHSAPSRINILEPAPVIFLDADSLTRAPTGHWKSGNRTDPVRKKNGPPARGLPEFWPSPNRSVKITPYDAHPEKKSVKP